VFELVQSDRQALEAVSRRLITATTGLEWVDLKKCLCGEWSEFDLHIEKTSETLHEAGLVDDDLADLLIRAADQSPRARRPYAPIASSSGR
jgi:hypothetical protein